MSMATKKHAEKDEQPLIAQDPRLLQAYYQEDEISLVDLWLVLAKRKRFIATVAGTIAVAGLLFALLMPRVYTYTTSIEIARDGDKLLESPQTVLAKLQESYIPLVLTEHAATGSDRIDITAKIPKGSDLIVLESKAGQEMAASVNDLHQRVVSLIVTDHDSTITFARGELRAQLHSAQNKLAELKDREKMLQNREQRLEEKAKLLTDQIESIRAVIAESRMNRKKAVSEVTGEAKAMTLLLIDNEIQQYQEREALLLEQLHIGLANERDGIIQEQANIRRAQDMEEEKILEIKARLASIKETRAITTAMRSLEPAGASRKLVLSVAILLGLILGVFAAFFAEFLDKVRERKAEVINGQAG